MAKQPVTFMIIGGGWRAEFYIRIAAALPDFFRITGMFVRDAEKGARLENKYNVRTYRTMDELLAHASGSFAVLSVPRTVSPDFMSELAVRGIPVLAETPPAADLEALLALYRKLPEGARIQVAEQYAFQPKHAARLAFARSGKLGDLWHAQVSAAHDYHGVSLIRQLLGVGFEDAVIQGSRFGSRILKGPSRQGPPAAEEFVDQLQDIAAFRFEESGKSAVYDFTREQYFSWIRSGRVLVRGSRGEIADDRIRYMSDYATPVYSELQRIDAGHDGNLEGYHHVGILAGERWLYRNPFAPARLSDEELAMAAVLQAMGDYAQGGPSFYSFAEAAQDQYLAIMMREAIERGTAVRTVRQPWAPPSP
ncbi:Gfo/Idh/MocA family oxidoreductase [Paenibacillus thailandensis]|uniref:Gfo/Idh/MocA family oxidoreductase n=1 Tax=Paenibacillus thailandensis TaxID=393250 RepID=A0ABW5QWT1_9BACL